MVSKITANDSATLQDTVKNNNTFFLDVLAFQQTPLQAW